MKQQLDVSQTARDVDTLLIEAGFIQAANKRTGEPAPFLQGSPKLFVINAIHGNVEHAVGGGENEAHRTPLDAALFLISIVGPKTPEAAPAEEVAAYTPAAEPEPAAPDPRDARIAELEALLAASPPPSPAVVALEGMEALRAKIDGVRKTGSIDTSGVDDLEPLTPDDLINMVADNPPGSAAELENTVRVIRGEARRRFTELLNVELSGLEQERAVGSAHANPKREQQIEYLLGLFARLGEI